MLRLAPYTAFSVSVAAPRVAGKSARGVTRVSTPRMSTPQHRESISVLYVKAAQDGKSVGDCPFSMKANLALRVKECEMDVRPIDLGNKPDWYLELNADGTTPTFVSSDEEVIDSSDEIVAWADENGTNKEVHLYQENSAFWKETVDVIGPVFGAFARLIKNKDETHDEELKSALLSTLEAVDGQLRKSGGPFLLGEKISALDCNLGPKLQHISVAGKQFKGFIIPERLDALHRYMKTLSTTPEWKAASCSEETIVWGWSKFFQ